jgi:ABC-2 family transporter protein
MNASPHAPALGERHEVPSTLSTVRTLAGVTLTRLGRGKALWIGILFAGLPLAFASVMRSRGVELQLRHLMVFSSLVLAVLPAMYIGSSIGEEIEERTTTYLWSRPIARWAVIAGKLCALTPIVIALMVGSWFGAVQIWTDAPPSLATCLALTAGSVATSLVAAGVATILPKHGMALTIGYMLVDQFIGQMPFALADLSITRQMRVLAGVAVDGQAISSPLIAMAIVSGIWLAVGALRIRRLES